MMDGSKKIMKREAVFNLEKLWMKLS